MNKVKSYQEYQTLAEKESKEGTSAIAPKAKNVVIDGKTYTAIPSTYKAIGAKQKEMGEVAVGVFTLPNEEEVYELLLQDDEKLLAKEPEKGKEEKGKEEKKEKK